MVLNTSSIFPRTTLLNDVGTISERWGQDDNEVENIAASGRTTTTLYTVAANRVLYITSIFLDSCVAGNSGCILRDGGAAGTIKFIGDLPAAPSSQMCNFSTPLKFTSNVYIWVDSSINISMSGWVERI